MPSQKGSSTTTTEPWAEQKPYLSYAFKEANRLYGQRPPSYYPGSTVANLTPWQNAGLNLTAGRALSGNPAVNMGGKQLQNILSGDLGLDAVYKDIEAKVLPSALSAYSAAGRTPGGAGSYGGYAANQLTQAYAPVAAQQMNNAFSLHRLMRRTITMTWTVSMAPAQRCSSRIKRTFRRR